MRKAKSIGMCKLCLGEKKLCQSHIIPDFMYEPLKGAEGKIHAISTALGKGRGKGRRVIQSGIWENLLCSECEKKLSSWETYAGSTLFWRVPANPQPTQRGVMFHGLDYHKFRLFQLSVLWRSSVATAMGFEKFKLNEHESTLRDMLMADDPGEPREFGCMMVAPGARDLAIMDELILPPETISLDDHAVARLVMGNMMWIYFLPAAPVEALQYGYIMSKGGSLQVAFAPVEFHAFLRSLALDLKKSGNLPEMEN